MAVSGAEELGVIAARLAAGGGEGLFQRGGIRDRRLGVGHGQHQSKTASQGGSRAAVPILLVGGAGFAQVDVGVDQTGKFEHDTSYLRIKKSPFLEKKRGKKAKR